MMDFLFWWTGLAVWSLIALAAVWFVVEWLWAAVVAIDQMRFTIACNQGDLSEIKWKYTFHVFFSYSWNMLGYRIGDKYTLRNMKSGSEWRGFRDWVLYSNDDEEDRT